MVKTSAQPYKHIIHAYVYNHICNEQPVAKDSNDAAHTLPCRTATTTTTLCRYAKLT